MAVPIPGLPYPGSASHPVRASMCNSFCIMTLPWREGIGPVLLGEVSWSNDNNTIAVSCFRRKTPGDGGGRGSLSPAVQRVSGS